MNKPLIRRAVALSAAVLAAGLLVPVHAQSALAAPGEKAAQSWSVLASKGGRWMPRRTVAPLPVPPASSTVAGAAVDRINQTFTASNGKSSRYHVYAAGVQQPAGLVLQFHGDGAYEFNNPSSPYSLGGSGGIVSQARSRGYITVPVLSPDKSGSVTWWEEGSANATYVNELLTRLKASYGIKSDDIWLVGYSGGAQFITQFYLPNHSASIAGGGAVVFGGGGAPRVAAKPFAASLTKSFPIHWYTGALDNGATSSDGYNALRDAKAGMAWYSQRGFVTSHEYPAGVGHGLSGRFGTVMARQLDAH